MSFHRNAKLGLAGRYALVSAIAGGMTLKRLRPPSACRRRRRTAGGTAGWTRARRRGRRCRVCSIARAGRIARRGSSRPSSRRRSAPVDARRAGGRGWSPARPASATRPSGRCSSGPGISRPPRPAREPANRYEWPCPGDLLHMDTSEYARFQRPGHRVTGDRSSQDRQHRDGDRRRARDRRRPLPARLRRDPRRPARRDRRRLPRARARLLRRARHHREAADDRQRLELRQEPRRCADCSPATRSGISRPSPTGRAPTARSSASTRRWRANGPTGSSTTHTASAPPPCHTGSTTTTRARPHSSLGGQPPISRVHNVRRQDI